MRNIATGGFAVECCTFSPLPTTWEDLTIWRGDDLLGLYPFLNAEGDTDFVPLVRARATPGGIVKAAAYHTIKEEFLAKLAQACPLDGLYLDMHGALFVEGMQDAEGDWITAARSVVGEECLIAASYDLHGNLSQRVVDGLDILTAYRTAPHIDGEETRQRALKLLITCLEKHIRPVMTHIAIPMLLPGEMAMTTAEPARSLYAGLPAVIDQYQLLDASYLVGYTWADEARASASAVAVAENRAQATTAAVRLAQQWWSQREEFQFGMPTGSVEECIIMAQNAAAQGTPVFISDAGDNITGGGVGDVPVMLEKMLAARLERAVFAAIVDPQAVDACLAAGIGSRISLSLGGKLDTLHGKPLAVNATILTINRQQPENPQVVLQVEGIQVIVTYRRTAFTEAAQFEQVGIDPLQQDIICVKLGYLFPSLQEIARSAVLAFSPGAINPDVSQLPFRQVRRPVYPLDPGMHWSPL